MIIIGVLQKTTQMVAAIAPSHRASHSLVAWIPPSIHLSRIFTCQHAQTRQAKGRDRHLFPLPFSGGGQLDLSQSDPFACLPLSRQTQLSRASTGLPAAAARSASKHVQFSELADPFRPKPSAIGPKIIPFQLWQGPLALRRSAGDYSALKVVDLSQAARMQRRSP